MHGGKENIHIYYDFPLFYRRFKKILSHFVCVLSQNRSSLRKRIFYILGCTGLFYFLFFKEIEIVYKYFMSSVIDLSLEMNLLFYCLKKYS